MNHEYDSTSTPETGNFGLGRLTKVTDLSGSTAFQYDKLGNNTKKIRAITGVAGTFATSSEYDALSREIKLTYPDGDSLNNIYTGAILTSVKNAANTLTYAALGYDNTAVGKLSSITYGNGVVTNYGYNPTNMRLTSLATTAPSGTIQNFGYSYDNLGNITSITDSVGAMSQSFIYDELSRLKLAVSAATYGSKYYEYDRTGNMIYNPDAQASASSYYLDGTLSGATISRATWTNGRLDQALSFDGNDSVSIPDTYESPTKGISLEFWLRRLAGGTILSKVGCYAIACDAQGTISAQLTMNNAAT